MEKLVLTEIKERIGYIVLNRPEKRNALSVELIGELKLQITSFLMNDAVKIIVLKSREGAFCAGADLAYLTSMRNNTLEENISDSQNLRELFDLIYNGQKVFIAQVEGPALAGGCGLATVCDFCFASPNATFGYTESKIGFVPALVMVYLRQKISGSTARQIFITGEIMEANKAKELGIVKEIYAENEIEAKVNEFAQNLCNTISASSVKFIKEMLSVIPGMSMNEALDMAVQTNAKARATEDCIKGMDAFLNKTKLSW